MSIAEYIEQDLQARIAGGGQLPAELTLAGLASHYGVSFTPVRVALRGLVEGGVVDKLPNGRFAVRSQRRLGQAGSVAAPPRPTDWDAVLTEEMIRRSLEGDDGFVREEATAERLGIGRTALRQVLGRLAGRSLLEHVPRRGWRVVPFRQRDMLDYLEVREALELKALDLAWAGLDRGRLEWHLAANSPDEAGQPRLDDTLHRYWIDLAANRYIHDFFSRYGAYFYAVFHRAAQDPGVRAVSSAEHRCILQAALEGDRGRATRALSEHIQGQRKKVTGLFRGIASG